MLDLHGISRAAFDLIVDEEVSGRATYDKKYVHPEKPGGQSGVTVGIGYDCGYYSAAQIRKDWEGKIPRAMVEALASCAGIKGDAAFAPCNRVRGIVSVPWDAAIDVFSNVSIPKYLASTKGGLPNFDLLPPDCKGVLLSVVYNRGASFQLKDDRYREMRGIRSAMIAKNFAAIPGLLRSMKRLWTQKSVRGVALRREHEARLFEQGLASMQAAPMVSVTAEEPDTSADDPTAPYVANAPSIEPPPADVDHARGGPAPAAPIETVGDPDLFSVQMRLKAMNYSPGIPTGAWGGMTAGAIAGFINDRGGLIAVPASLDAFNSVRDELKAELQRAEAQGFKRPVTSARASEDVTTVASVAPEVLPARRSFFATLYASLAAFFASIWQTLSNWLQQAFGFFSDHKDDLPSDPGVLDTIKGTLAEVPLPVWLALGGVLLGVLAWDAWRGVRKITESVATGARQ